jgi:hypothetical protein
MWRLARAGVRRAFGLYHPGRNLDVFPDDIFLVSYPKSGNTWTRFLVANLVYPEKNIDFANLNEVTPDPEALSKRRLSQKPRPRILKSHAYFDPRYPRVIYIVRDPRDVVISSYYFEMKRQNIPQTCSLEEFVPLFVRGLKDHNYGNWADNVSSWFYTRRYNPGFLLLTYEALQADGMRELGRVAEFLRIPADRGRLATALEKSSADRMRELEKKQGDKWSSIRETRQDIPFVRKAKAGGWRTDLPQSCVEEIELAWGRLISDLGYPLTTIDVPDSNSHGATSAWAPVPAPVRGE